MSKRATFRQGSFASTGLHDAVADAAMTIDALQYAPNKSAAIAEIARIVRPGGRFCCVAFELDAQRVGGMGVWEDAVEDYRPLLDAAGFEVVSYEQTPSWREAVETGFRAVIEEQDILTAELGEAAAKVLALEAAITLQLTPYCGHILAIADRRAS